MIRLFTLLFASGIAIAAVAAPAPTAGTFKEFNVELPIDLRKVAGRGKLSPVTHALVTIAVPANFDTTHDWPVLVISATSDLEYRSSRRLLRAYADTALAVGWVVVAADPAEDIPVEQDDVAMRLALNTAALGVVALMAGARNGSLPAAFRRCQGVRLARGGLCEPRAQSHRGLSGRHRPGHAGRCSSAAQCHERGVQADTDIPSLRRKRPDRHARQS